MSKALSDGEVCRGAFGTVCGWKDRLSAAETEPELFRTVVEIALEDLQLSTVTVFYLDEGAATLRPEATSEEAVDPVSPGEHPIWGPFKSGAATVFDGAGSGTGIETDDELGYQFAVPFGKNGVIAAGGAERPDDDGVVEAVRLLCVMAESALAQIQYKTQLREHDRALEQQTRQIQRTERITETYRRVIRATISADTQSELDTAICDGILENDIVEFVWIGELNRAKEEIAPREWAGSEQGYLENAPFKLDGDGEPTVRAARDNGVSVVDNVAADHDHERWRSEALERGFRSVMAVPLSHDGILHGVVTIYADRPNAFEAATDLASETGGLIGYATTAIQRKNSLMTYTSTELDVRITAPACFFVRFIRETGTGISFEAMYPGNEGSVVVLARADAPELLFEYAEKAVTVESVELLEDGPGGDIVKGRFDNSFIGSFLSSHGIVLEGASATPEEVRITVSIPPQMSVRQALEIIDAEYPGSTLLAKRENQTRSEAPIASRLQLLERLTDRQREVVKRAYQEGYFETPKQATGESLAASMDLSASAFHNHLRNAEDELFTWLFDDGSER